jgi:hypothetical protein
VNGAAVDHDCQGEPGWVSASCITSLAARSSVVRSITSHDHSVDAAADHVEFAA